MTCGRERDAPSHRGARGPGVVLAADPTVKVITDRRWAERRRDSLGHRPDRRRGDRRHDERYVSLALRSAGWVEVGMRTPDAEKRGGRAAEAPIRRRTV